MTFSTTNAHIVSSIQAEMSQVKENLKCVDEDLKKLTGRDFAEGRTERRNQNLKKDIHYNTREEESVVKKRAPTGIFARLGAPILDGNRKDNRGNRHRLIEFSGEKEELKRNKPSLSSSVSRAANDTKSRSEAAAELTKDRASRDRNKRMFGALLGTLQKFQNDEARQKDKDEQRAAIEKKLEDKGKAEKEQLRKERTDLFNERVEQQAKMKFLQYKMNRVREHESWEIHQKKLRKFIRTESKPNIFWVPKVFTDKTSQLIKKTKVAIDDELEDKRNQFKCELEEASIVRRNTYVKEGPANNCGMPQAKKMKIADCPLEEALGDLEENCADILDFEVEETRQVEEVDPSGKDPNPERVVVQVGSSVNGLGNSSERRVELVRVSRNGRMEHDKMKGENESKCGEVEITKCEKIKVSKSNKNDESCVRLSEHKSEREVRESRYTRKNDFNSVITTETPNKKELNECKTENSTDIGRTDIVMVQEKVCEASDMALSKSPNVEHQITSTKEVDLKKLTESKVANDICEKKTISGGAEKRDDSSSSSSSDDSDDYGDSSSTSDSDSSQSDSSDSTSSTSTDSERMRQVRKKSLMAVRKREEERRRKRSSSNSSSSSHHKKSRVKRSRNHADDVPASSKRIKQTDATTSKDKRNSNSNKDKRRVHDKTNLVNK